jgi:hypothetical protein
MRSTQLPTNVLIQRVIIRELPRQTFLVKSVSDGAQSKTFGGDVLLPFHVSPTDDQRDAVKGWVRKFVILQNGFKVKCSPR